MSSDSQCENGSRIPPNPPRTWNRYTPNCAAIAGFTTEQLDMRRKVQILAYQGTPALKTSNVNGKITKVQRYVNAVKGKYLPNKTFAVQTQVVTNPNPDDLPRACGTDISDNDCFVLDYSQQSTIGTSVCLPPPEPTSASDVPGPIINLQIDPAVPITNLAIQRTYVGQQDGGLPDGPT